MDKGQLVTIVVTAAITAIVVGSLKWIFSIFDAVIPISAANEKVKKLFSAKRNRRLLLDVLTLGVIILGFVALMREKTPITRWTIVELIGIFFSFFLWLVALSLDMIIARIERRRQGGSNLPTLTA